MRQFRGKPIDPKQAGEDGFVYGWINKHGGRCWIAVDDGEAEVRRFASDWVECLMVEVHPDTVEQDTGLKDKNGKAGYFGQKVKHDHGYIGEIKWDDEALRVYFEWEDNRKTYPQTHYDIIDFEIIHDKGAE